MVDLRSDLSKLQKFIIDEMENFRQTYGLPSAVGVYVCPPFGWISLNFNRSLTIEETYNNCPDFEVVEYALMELHHWEREYEQVSPEIISHSGVKLVLEADFGDEEFSQPFFEGLKEIIEGLEIACKNNEVLVQVLDSTLVKKYDTIDRQWISQ